MFQAGIVYNTLISKKKERFDIILEPLQSFIQLALLSFTPIDSKLNISNNILYIQIPGWKQSIMRTYYSDSKNDLFYLFNIINRFSKFYEHLKTVKNNNTNLFVLLKKLSSRGIDNLLQTYKQTENPALLHTLKIYKSMLNNFHISHENPHQANIKDNHEKNVPENQIIIQNDEQLNYELSSEESSPKTSRSTSPISSENSINQLQLLQNTHIDIDQVFINITKLYTEHDYIIIFNTLELIQKNPNNYLDYIEGLNKILEPINNKIKKWIVDNIVY